jgi:hypothetical protein
MTTTPNIDNKWIPADDNCPGDYYCDFLFFNQETLFGHTNKLMGIVMVDVKKVVLGNHWKVKFFLTAPVGLRKNIIAGGTIRGGINRH